MAFFKEWLCFKERQCFKERLFGGRLDELDPKYFEINARKILSGLGFADHLVRETHKCPQSAAHRVPHSTCHLERVIHTQGTAPGGPGCVS